MDDDTTQDILEEGTEVEETNVDETTGIPVDTAAEEALEALTSFKDYSDVPEGTAPIVQVMKRSYLNYAMSVIVMRALPDVRDGLKPVHRRILYAMYKLGLNHKAKFSKSAGVVGEVLGKYHPHGDSAVYDSLVRMGQTFSMRYPLIHSQGNFGSIDGDRPAAMRYTEAKMMPIALSLIHI